MVKHWPFTASQSVLLLAPPFLLATTYFLFRSSAQQLGPARAYRIGFLFYWIIWCFGLSFLTVGFRGIGQMFSPPDPLFGRPNWLGFILLLGPPLITLLTKFPSEIRSATPTFLAVSTLYALANGTMEEMLWRGSYVVTFPGSWLWGVIYPSIWFGLWHLSPQVVEAGGVTRGTLAFALMSITLGLAWGFVAKTSGSIQLTVATHILLNLAAPVGAWFIS
ncbi:MAG TPA: CPBP family intramembrane metalloprotease [Caldilineae bacterium]|nr:CPBP family intramembrane metalloprotease [Caldilineae bacterium]